MKRRFSAFNLVGTIRGEGELKVNRRLLKVQYEISVFDQGGHRTSSGGIEGDLRLVKGLADGAQGVLTLSDARAVPVILTGVDEGGASIELIGDLAAALG